MEKYKYQNYILTKDETSENFGTWNSISIFEDGNLVYKKSFITAKPELNISAFFTNTVIENIYTPDGEFLINSTPDSNGVSYLHNEDSDKADKMDKQMENLISKQKIKKALKLSKQSLRIPIEHNGVPSTNNIELLNKYRDLKDKYHSIENSIMYYAVLSSLQETQQLINAYIAIGSIDFEKLIEILNSVAPLSDIIPTIYPHLLDFAKHSEDIDLRDVSEQLSNSIKSISNIIKLKFEKSPFNEEYKGEEINES